MGLRSFLWVFEVQIPPVFDFMGTDIHISFGFSFGSYQCGHWYYSFSIFNILSFLLFKKGCLRMSSILEICWSYSIQA